MKQTNYIPNSEKMAKDLTGMLKELNEKLDRLESAVDCMEDKNEDIK